MLPVPPGCTSWLIAPSALAVIARTIVGLRWTATAFRFYCCTAVGAVLVGMGLPGSGLPACPLSCRAVDWPSLTAAGWPRWWSCGRVLRVPVAGGRWVCSRVDWWSVLPVAVGFGPVGRVDLLARSSLLARGSRRRSPSRYPAQR